MNPEYSDATSTITINPNDPPWKQLDNFAHESFHATHQGMRDLYLNGPITDKLKYVETYAKLEIGSFKEEIGVHNELSSHMAGADDVLYKWADKEGQPQPDMNLAKLYGEKGDKGLYDFIMDTPLADQPDFLKSLICLADRPQDASKARKRRL